MFLSWIIKTIPRSPRALLALIVMLCSVALLLWALQDMFAPIGEVDKTMVILKLIAGLGIGLPATAVFYWFQAAEDGWRHKQSRIK